MADFNGKLYKGGYSGLTHTDIAAFLSKTLSSTEQTVVDALIADIEDYLCRACRRNFLIVDGTTDRYYEITDAGKEKCYLTNAPIKEVLEIKVDSADWYLKGGGSNRLVLGVDFFVYETQIIFETVPYSALNDRRAMTIYYDIEQFWGNDLKLAVKRWVSDLFLTREYGGTSFTRFNVERFLVEFSPNSLPDFIQSVVESYRRIRM